VVYILLSVHAVTWIV